MADLLKKGIEQDRRRARGRLYSRSIRNMRALNTVEAGGGSGERSVAEWERE